MRKISLFGFALLLISTSQTSLFGQENQKLDRKAILEASEKTLLTMPGPPVGYTAVKTPLVIGGKLSAFRYLISKEGSVDKVLIVVETRKLTERALRVTAVKAYVNAFRDNMIDAGFQVAKSSKMPNLKTETFKKPIKIDVEFSGKGGTKIFSHKRILFKNLGYNFSILSTEKKELAKLIKWASQVKPVK